MNIKDLSHRKMNDFDTWSKLKQWSVTIVLMGILIAVMAVWMNLIFINFLFYFLLFLIAPIYQFCFTPFARLTGMYKYLSPMLLVFAPSDEKYDLHNGTSFDYLLVMRKHKGATAIRNKILEYYLEGLLKVIKKIENEELPATIIVRGSSYFFSDTTAKRLGFSLKETGSAERFNIIFNYLDLLWMYSLSKGKLTFPKLSNIKTAEITGTALVQQKTYFEKLYKWLKSRN